MHLSIDAHYCVLLVRPKKKLKKLKTHLDFLIKIELYPNENVSILKLKNYT